VAAESRDKRPQIRFSLIDRKRSALLNSSLEVLALEYELRLGYVFVSTAESAYKRQDVGRAYEARARGQAAYYRASRLLASVTEGGRGALAADLACLQAALNELFQTQGSLTPDVLTLSIKLQSRAVVPFAEDFQLLSTVHLNVPTDAAF